MDVVQSEREKTEGKGQEEHLQDEHGGESEGRIGQPVPAVHEAHAENKGQRDPQGGAADFQQKDKFQPHGCLFEGSMKRGSSRRLPRSSLSVVTSGCTSRCSTAPASHPSS